MPVVRLMKLRRVIVLSWCLGACFMAYNYRPPACVFLIQRCLPHFQNWLGTSNTDRSDHSGSDDRPFAPMASHVRIRRVMIPAYTWISEARRYWKGGGALARFIFRTQTNIRKRLCDNALDSTSPPAAATCARNSQKVERTVWNCASWSGVLPAAGRQTRAAPCLVSGVKVRRLARGVIRRLEARRSMGASRTFPPAV